METVDEDCTHLAGTQVKGQHEEDAVLFMLCCSTAFQPALKEKVHGIMLDGGNSQRMGQVGNSPYVQTA
jgi:hypothetical protein